MSKTIGNLGSKECEDKNNSTCQPNNPHNSLLLIIVDIFENYVSIVNRKLYKRKDVHHQ